MSDFIDEQQDEMDTRRLSDLFRKFDLNGDGRIDLEEIVSALKGRGHNAEGAIQLAKTFLARSDADNSGDVSIDEFIQHLKAHEMKLKQVFKEVDRNNDGSLDIHELIKAAEKLGIKLSLVEAANMISKMDEDGSNDISFEEWRGFLLLSPGSELNEVINYWKNATFFDIGESAAVPADLSPKAIKNGMWWRHLVAGGIAGAVSRTATAPLDRIKVFLQVHGKNSAATKDGIMGCLRSMIREGGVLSLWRGNGINVIKIAPESAVKFMAYEQLKTLIRGKNSNRDIRIEERFLAGSLAGAISQTAIYPLEVIKTRLALRKTGEFKSVAEMTIKMFQREGPKCFFKGYVPSIIGILPYAGIDLAIYETLKRAYLRQDPTSDPPVLLLLACATVSSTCGQIASYPLALVRTQLQASKTNYATTMSSGLSHNNNNHPQSLNLIFRTIVEKEGFVGLFRGILPNFLKTLPAVSISYVVYEKCRQALGVTMT